MNTPTMTENAPKTPKEPAPGTIAARAKDTANRLNLSEPRAAEYFGVPVYTYRKWATGEREPGAAVTRLLDVLGMIEALAPALHDSFLPPEIRHVRKSRTKKSIGLIDKPIGEGQS